MRIATYNVMSGGFNDYHSASTMPERLQELQEALRDIDADVVGLTDTFRWKDIYTEEDLKHLFDYPYVFHIDMDDTRVDKRIGLAVLSRVPIQWSETDRLHNRNGIRIRLDEHGKAIDVFIVYLDDLSETTRLDEARALIKIISNNVTTVVMGDLNAIAPVDVVPVQKGVENFLASKAGVHLADTLRPLAEQVLRAEVLPAFERAGFEIPTEPSLPTALTGLHSFRMPRPIFPVDHVLIKEGRISGKKPLTGGIFEHASDHYPVVANIALD